MVKTYRIAKKMDYKYIILSSVAALAFGGFVGYISGYQQGKQNTFFKKYGDVRLETNKTETHTKKNLETPHNTSQFDMHSVKKVNDYVMFEKWVNGKITFNELKSVQSSPIKDMVGMFAEQPKTNTLAHAIENKYFGYKVFANKYATAVIDPYLKKREGDLINLCLRKMGEGRPSKFVISNPQDEVEKLHMMWIVADESDIVPDEKEKYFLRKEQIDLMANYIAAEFDLKERKQQLSQMNLYGEQSKKLFSLYNYLVYGVGNNKVNPKVISELLHEHTGKKRVGDKFINHFQEELAEKYDIKRWMVASLNKAYYTEKEVEALHKMIKADAMYAIKNYLLPALEEANEVYLASSRRKNISPLVYRINYLLDEVKQLYIDEVHKKNKDLEGIEKYAYQSIYTSYLKELLKQKQYQKAKQYLNTKQTDLGTNEQWVLAKLKSKGEKSEERIEAWDLFYGLFNKSKHRDISNKEKICTRMLPLVKDVRGTSSKYDRQISEIYKLAVEMKKSQARREKIERINTKWKGIENDEIQKGYAHKLFTSLSEHYSRELHHLDDTLMINIMETSLSGKNTSKYQEMLTRSYLKQIGKRIDNLHPKDVKILCLIADSGEAYGIRSIRYLSNLATKNNDNYLPKFIEAYNQSQKHYSARMLVSSFNSMLNKIKKSDLEEQVSKEKMEVMQGYIDMVKEYDQHNIWHKLQTKYDAMNKVSVVKEDL